MKRIVPLLPLSAVLFFLIACHVARKTAVASAVGGPDGTAQPSPGQVAVPLPVFDKEGHRGCRGLMPENTIPAMIRALEIGVTTLEMDAHITKDSQVIISHDPFFNKSITTLPDGSYLDDKTEKNYVLYRMNYAETQLPDVGLKPFAQFPRQQKMAVHKPLLSNLIDSVETWCRLRGRTGPFYNIETKTTPTTDGLYHPGPEVFVDQLMAVIASKGIAPRVIIQSFDPRTLQVIHRKYPGIRTSLLIGGGDKRGLDLQCSELGFTPSIYSPSWELVDAKLLQDCHDRSMKLIPWTVDDKETLERLRTLGVDGIITDYPDLF